MAIADATKRDYVIDKIKEYFDSLETWDDVKNFIQTVTKARVKTFIKNKLEELAVEEDGQADFMESEAPVIRAKAQNIRALKTEVDGL